MSFGTSRIVFVFALLSFVMFGSPAIKAGECSRLIAQENRIGDIEHKDSSKRLDLAYSIKDSPRGIQKEFSCLHEKLDLKRTHERIARRNNLERVCGKRATQNCNAACWKKWIDMYEHNIGEYCPEAEQRMEKERRIFEANHAWHNAREMLGSSPTRAAEDFKKAADLFDSVGQQWQMVMVLAEAFSPLATKEEIPQWYMFTKQVFVPGKPARGESDCKKIREIAVMYKSQGVDVKNIESQYKYECGDHPSFGSTSRTESDARPAFESVKNCISPVASEKGYKFKNLCTNGITVVFATMGSENVPVADVMNVPASASSAEVKNESDFVPTVVWACAMNTPGCASDSGLVAGIFSGRFKKK